jgi:hypothetical protein
MIITRSTSIVLGFAFVLLGGISVWLVLEAWSRVKAAKASAQMLASHPDHQASRRTRDVSGRVGGTIEKR